MGPQRFRRGDDNHKQRVCAVGCASMGPQRFRRGDSDLHLSAGYLIVLQWGRNVSVAEIPTGVTTTGGSVTASMGPQRFRRGDHRASPLRATGALASMGPQRFRRGDSAWTRSIVLTSTLQWGRNVSVAEMDGRGTSVTPVRVLQWGRNVSVAEMTMASGGALTTVVASMGPQRFRRGDWPYLGWRAFPSHASMGPQRFRRGDFAGPLLSTYTTSFNGAATFPSRRCNQTCRSTCNGIRRFNGAATFPSRR